MNIRSNNPTDSTKDTFMRLRTSLLATLALPALNGCWDLPPGDVTDVWYWGNAMLDKYSDELFDSFGTVDSESAPTPLEHKRTVLLVTGVTIKKEFFGPIV